MINSHIELAEMSNTNYLIKGEKYKKTRLNHLIKARKSKKQGLIT